jgi:hypothetical protein
MSRTLSYRIISRQRTIKNKATKIGEIVKRRLKAEKPRVRAEALTGIEFLSESFYSGIPASYSLSKSFLNKRLTPAQLTSLTFLKQRALECGFIIEINSTEESPVVCVKLKKSDNSETLINMGFVESKALPAPSNDFIDFTGLFDSTPGFEKIPLKKEDHHE